MGVVGKHSKTNLDAIWSEKSLNDFLNSQRNVYYCELCGLDSFFLSSAATVILSLALPYQVACSVEGHSCSESVREA